jgi:hypothetical protein
MDPATDTRMPVSLFGLDPSEYRSHYLHSYDRTYVETNCYTDIVIEMLHARGDEPIAAMGAVVRMDFEGDQWTFLKPAPEDLERLYGIDVHEMQPYRSLPDQVAEQLERGRTLIVELDSWYLPDTAATSYRTAHVKSSVVMEAVDRNRERLHYFHAAGLYSLEGEDYRNVFRLGRSFSEDVLPPYTELVRFDAGERLRGDALGDASRVLLVGHLAGRPASNPFVRFGGQLELDVETLLAGDAQRYHDYAFATVRMAGSAFEVASSYVEWLFGEDAAAVSSSFREIVDGCKVLSLRLARRRPFAPVETTMRLAEAWERAMAGLDELAG